MSVSRPCAIQYSAAAQPAKGARYFSPGVVVASATRHTVCSRAPAARSVAIVLATLERFWPISTYTQSTPRPF